MSKNRLRMFREAQLLTKAELARRAGISTLTIDRIEAGLPCRMDTKRKIILALGLKITDKAKIFAERAPQKNGRDLHAHPRAVHAGRTLERNKNGQE